jgi:hypothetical protein
MKAANERSKRLKVVRPSGQVSARFDEAAGRIDETLPSAISMADALKMLGACAEEGPDGWLLRSATIPNVAVLLTRMLEQIEKDTDTMRDEYDALARPQLVRP